MIKKINNLILSRKPQSKTIIPQIIHQTYKSNTVPVGMYDSAMSWVKKNPSFEYRFYDDAACEALIEEHIEGDVISAYKLLPKGAFRADLWRYCCLYINGGVYADMDTVCRSSLLKLIKGGEGLIVPRGRLNKSFLFNAFICVEPKNSVMRCMIYKAAEKINAGLGECDRLTYEIFKTTFRNGLVVDGMQMKKDKLLAQLFGLLGPLGLGRCVNSLMGNDPDRPFYIGRQTVNNEKVRVLRFGKRFGVTDGFRRVLDPKYDGYHEDQVKSGSEHWLS